MNGIPITTAIDPHIAAIWPDDGESGLEHALVLRRFESGAIHIIQNDQCVYVPQCAIGPLMTTLREMALVPKRDHVCVLQNSC